LSRRRAGWLRRRRLSSDDESSRGKISFPTGESRMSTTPSQPPTHDSSDNPLAKFSDVRAKPPAWLWPNWLPLGKLAILDGDPGVGKSTLLFDLAARVSSSGVMPDGAQGAS